MKMMVTDNDIYDIRIDHISTGNDGILECGYASFETYMDNVYYSSNNDLVIEISGTCSTYGYYKPIKCKFNGKLEMNSDTFTYEYTNSAEHCRKYIQFNGDICIKFDLSVIEHIDSTDIDESFYDTIQNIMFSYDCIGEDNAYYATEIVIKNSILKMNTDKIIEIIKKIDKDILEENTLSNNQCLYEYLIENVIDECDGEIKNDRYSKLDSILLKELTKIINNGTINDIIKDAIDEFESDCVNDTHCEVVADVFFSDLDP